ncbi:sugar phosphate isomerase/epimerase family protein [Leifsonia aquatica]|uniref:sugar phosphate isomerase/epimerase family protein n=1 Tax=Leifsonia aquatica TaxID=144185 RepID=UPI00046A7611|nr:sugar phosphate isomerase/epimerase family protein [Leifsonia aquatica]
MNTLSVSTYSVREQLGPVDFTFVDPSGRDVHISFPFTKELDLSDFPGRAKSTFGVGAIETVAFQFAGVDDPELDRFAAALSENGVTLLNAAIDAGDLLEADPAKRAAGIVEIQRWIDRFAAMGATYVRVNPGSPMVQHSGDDLPDHLVEALRRLGAYATERGSRLLVENHGGPSSDPVWMNRLLDAVGHEHLGLLLDLGNFDALMLPTMALLFGGPDGAQVSPEDIFAGLDLTSLYQGIEALAPRAELVHVKAHAVGDDGVVGPVDLNRALGILAAHGYSGALTVEYEGTGGDPWAKSARVLQVAAAAAAEVAR